MALEGPTRGTREPQDGPKSAQERSKSALRGIQNAILGTPEGVREFRNPSSLIDRLQDGPKRRPGGPKRRQDVPKIIPRLPQEAPKRSPDTHPLRAVQRVQNGPRRLQERLGKPRTSIIMPYDSLRCLKMAPKMLQEARRPPQDSSKRPRRPQDHPAENSRVILIGSP